MTTPPPLSLPASPCVRQCCLDRDGELCLGCFRTLAEIMGWQAAGAAERACILARCAQRRAAHAGQARG
ncbi:MAG: DUF1289 domain-containing protein [Candidatus Dactylopiibacterium sp.]|nr:DUF1289 domain-containing protein [Candidatus Dactylopiibacterium sp.]